MTDEQTAAIERISAGLPTVFNCRIRTQSFRDAIHLTNGECEVAFPVELLASADATAFFACPISSPGAKCETCARDMDRGEPHAAECASALAQDGGA